MKIKNSCQHSLFQMLGAALLGLGIWLHLTNVTLLTVSPGYSLLMPSALFIAPGCLSLIVGFLGCCGAVTENKCLILTVSSTNLPIICFN